MLRRHLIALGGRIVAIAAGVPAEKIAELKVGQLLDDLGDVGTEPVPLPSRLTPADVARVRGVTRQLSDAGRTYGFDADVDSRAAAAAARLLEISAPDSVRRELRSAVAERHRLAGWSAFDAGLYRRALYYYARALELATEAGDAYEQAFILNYAGLAAIEHGHPDDGLKLLQAAQVAAWRIPRDDPRRVVAQACPLMDSATALAMLGDHREASRCVAAARDLWTPTTTDRNGDMDSTPARLELDRGRLDLAEQFAIASVRRWDGINRFGRTRSSIVRATIHVTAGERDSLQLAHTAIIDATRLTSVRARAQLLPLAEALDARPGADARELAQTARQIAA